MVGGVGSDLVRAGAGNDLVIGDNATINWTSSAAPSTSRPSPVTATRPATSGRRPIFGGDGEDLLVGRTGSDSIDGGAGRDQVFGDGVRSTARDFGNHTSPRFRLLLDAQIYSTDI